ncbi:MAG: hypothetical protein PHZ11_09310 [Desulfitobacteriaceae bacterium]|nr:hypothetical protein [Desulfitobacteriaceae bacterium]
MINTTKGVIKVEANKENKQLFNTKEYCISFYSLPKHNLYFGNNPTIQREKIWDKNCPNRIQDISGGSYPNIVLLTPAIFGGFGAFMVSFLLRRRRLNGNFGNRVDEEVSGQYLETYSKGFYKLEFFLNVLSVIALSSCTAYVYKVIKEDGGMERFVAIVLTVVIIIFLIASEEFLLHTVCPGCFEGVICNSAVGDFLNFVALSIGAISVGESYGITPKTTGTKILLAQEGLFNLFVLALLISLIVP